MSKIFYLIFFWLCSMTVQSQSITHAEYFFDVDPGPGNATPITGFSADDTLSISATISTTGLGQGFHFLAVRVKDVNNLWSHFETRGFYIYATPVATTNLVAAEYFFDLDPGPGNGTPLSIGMPDDSINLVTLVPQSLAGGFHTLVIRVRDQDGHWSLFERRSFYIQPPPDPMPGISEAEYYIDTDPGVGNGIPIPIGGAADTIMPAFSIPISDTAALGEYFYAIRVRDLEGNWSQYQYDTVIVAITLPPDTSLFAETGLCTKVVNGLDAETIDSEPYSYTLSGATTGSGSGSASGLAFNSGVTVVTYTLDNFPTATASFTVTILDNEIPNISCPANITVGADENVCGAVVNYSVTFSDNCPGASLLLLSGLASGSTFPAGVTINTFRATDTSGNSSTCSFSVTVLDDVPPMLTCPVNLSVNTDPGVCTASNVILGSPTVSDNCLMDTTINNGLTTYPLGLTQVTWTATDAIGNTNTCIQNVTVVDNQNPVVTCPANITMSADPGTCTNSVTYSATATDNCGVSGISYSPTSGSTFSVGTTLVTATATDVNGRTGTCTFTVTITDTEDPVITCPANITVNAETGECDENVMFMATATDNCGVPVITYNPNSGSTFPVGITIVTATATDGGGRTDECVFTVTVIDDQSPAITCPPNLTINTDAGLCTASSVALGSPAVNDNCGNDTTTNNGLTNYPLGLTQVTWTTTDENGNTNTCIQNITVVDNQNPMVTCPANITMNADPGTCTKSVTYAANATDNCGVSGITYSPTSGSTFSVGTTIVTATATDVNGRTSTCTFTVTITDTEDPVITCPANITVTAENGECDENVMFMATATDNCGVPVITYFPNSGSAFPVGITIVTATATDGGGRTDECVFTVTVIDDQSPAITCPANITVSTDAGICTASGVMLGTPIVNDNCDIDTTTNNGLSVYPVGMTNVTWITTDVNGLTDDCLQTITVKDNEPPVITTCPPNVTVNTDPGDCGGTVNFSFDGTDNCGLASIASTTFQSGEAFPVGVSVVTILATDLSGNTSTCTFSATVVDNEPPAINCPNNINIAASPGLCSRIVNFSVNVLDNCVGPMVVSVPASGSSFPVGTTIVTSTATDASGNSSTCTFHVIVTDEEVPGIVCPVNVTVNTDPGLCTASGVMLGSPITSDNCAVNMVTNNAPAVYPKGMTNVIWTVTDIYGLTSSCVQTVTVIDNEPPSITCPSDINVFAAPGGQPAIVNYPAPVFSDNCPFANILQTAGLPSGSSFPMGNTVNTFIVTDGSGLTASCSFTVNVRLGRVGINTTSPLAMLHVVDSSVVFTGPYPVPSSPEPPPIEGSGSRMMWYADKAAFRAGSVNGGRWDKDSIGLYSLATGFNTQASGIASMSVGNLSKALDSCAVSLGNANIASGKYSVSLGNANTASGQAAMAMGSANTASGFASAALGFDLKAIGDATLATGIYNEAIGNYSSAFNYSNRAMGIASSVFGFNIIAKAYNLFVAGQYNDTTAIDANMWNPLDPLFIIGNGSTDSTRNNALTVLKNGKTGLNTRDPKYRLHVVSTDGGSGGVVEGILVENTNFNGIGEAGLSWKTPLLPASRKWIAGLNQNPHWSLNYQSEFGISGYKIRLDTMGYVGIGRFLPSANLHVIRTDTTSGLFTDVPHAIFESTLHSYLQLSNPTDAESGILSGNQSTDLRSGIVFKADSSIVWKAGGDTTHMVVSKSGNTGIGTTTPAAKMEVAGTSRLGANGTALQEMIKATVNIDVPVIVNNGTSAVFASITNAAVGSSVMLSPSGLLNNGLIISSVRVSSPGSVEIRLTNKSGANIDPPAMDYYFVIIR